MADQTTQRTGAGDALVGCSGYAKARVATTAADPNQTKEHTPMLTLYQTLERLALQTSRFDGSIDKAAQAIALIFKAEILHHPWGHKFGRDGHVKDRIDANAAIAARNLIWNRLAKPRDMQHLIVLVIRDLQDNALTILRERGERLGLILDAGDERQQALVLEAWDALPEPPVYTALAKAIEKV